jgi:2-amino-4-hydroxy-6-hydroxymethyldihydropteridine diphosphokinase
MNPEARTGIALGSNVGDRAGNLAEAVRRIAGLAGTRVTSRSTIWESDPVDCPPGSASFLNAVVEARTNIPPLDLLDRLQHIEGSLGRPPVRPQNSPRTIDLDILYYDDVVLDLPRLTLPHPRASVRAFVLLPLEQIRPDLDIPGGGGVVRELAHALSREERETVRKWGTFP